ncbi:MAG: hypothetical protein KDJ38_18515, partial [Gammaproteobacteria bacterium]|nr:hypothetical protein [Gammaproteobacteria bacterium]
FILHFHCVGLVLVFQMNKLTDQARHYPCIRCGRPDETRAAHYNGLRQYMLGKGRGIKCCDIASAHLCHSCDQLFTEGHNENWDNTTERSEEFLFWCLMTAKRLYDDGRLK